MNIIADTNVLVRAITGDHPEQSKAAEAALSGADLVALPLSALCELVWILSRGYDLPFDKVAEAVRRLVNTANVVADRPAVEAGLAFMAAGADFADGVIDYEGRWLGADVFVSFDQRAVRILKNLGKSALSLL